MSIFKRPGSPYYYAEFQIQGNRFCRSTRRTTEREARAEERRLRDEARAGLAERAGADALSLDQGFGRYWREHGHKLAWAAEVERYIEQILAHVDKDMPIERLSDAEVNDFVQARLRAGGGRYAINRALAVWRAMHRRARKRWKQRTQEIDWADVLNPESKRLAYFTLEEARRLIDCLPARVALAVEWSLYTGCRKFETFGLVWENVHLDRGYATVTKKGGGTHTVWLSEQAMDVLARCERAGRYVFDRRGVRRIFAAGLKKAGLEGHRWHDLRHTHATWLRQAKVPVEVVQRSLGHTQLSTTMRYAHVDDTEVQEALRRLPILGTNRPNVVSIKSRRLLRN
ncbi:MAG TPA: site-specific integrase [Xanthobacteraceae bacterium]|nr:site-specific integrase [Xanthobacteraceae bacterium]